MEWRIQEVTAALHRRLLRPIETLRELKALEHSIAALISTCNATCAGGPAADCSIFEDLRAG